MPYYLYHAEILNHHPAEHNHRAKYAADLLRDTPTYLHGAYKLQEPIKVVTVNP